MKWQREREGTKWVHYLYWLYSFKPSLCIHSIWMLTKRVYSYDGGANH